mgnify:CR=1 FL=1
MQHGFGVLGSISVKGELNESKVKDILNEYYENNSAFSLFSDDFKQNYILAGFNYYKQFIGISKEYTVNYLMKYYYTWDLFSLSILYLNFLTSFKMKNVKLYGDTEGPSSQKL